MEEPFVASQTRNLIQFRAVCCLAMFLNSQWRFLVWWCPGLSSQCWLRYAGEAVESKEVITKAILTWPVSGTKKFSAIQIHQLQDLLFPWSPGQAVLNGARIIYSDKDFITWVGSAGTSGWSDSCATWKYITRPFWFHWFGPLACSLDCVLWSRWQGLLCFSDTAFRSKGKVCPGKNYWQQWSSPCKLGCLGSLEKKMRFYRACNVGMQQKRKLYG